MTVKEQPQVVKTLREIMEACPAITIQHALAAMRDRPDYAKTLEQLKVPALIIVGEQDAIAPPHMSELMKQKIKDATLAIILNAGHMAPLEQPAKVNQVLRKFMQDHWS